MSISWDISTQDHPSLADFDYVLPPTYTGCPLHRTRRRTSSPPDHEPPRTQHPSRHRRTRISPPWRPLFWASRRAYRHTTRLLRVDYAVAPLPPSWRNVPLSSARTPPDLQHPTVWPLRRRSYAVVADPHQNQPHCTLRLPSQALWRRRNVSSTG